MTDGVFTTLISVSFGYSLNLLRDWFANKKEAAREKQKKLQEIILVLPELSTWQSQLMEYYFCNGLDVRNKSPFAIIQTNIDLFFPEFYSKLVELDYHLMKLHSQYMYFETDKILQANNYDQTKMLEYQADFLKAFHELKTEVISLAQSIGKEKFYKKFTAQTTFCVKCTGIFLRKPKNFFIKNKR